MVDYNTISEYSLTEYEQLVIEQLRCSELYLERYEPVNENGYFWAECWAHEILDGVDGIPKSSLPGVLGSLEKKGIISQDVETIDIHVDLGKNVKDPEADSNQPSFQITCVIPQSAPAQSIPESTDTKYYCTNCKRMHNRNSKIGKAHDFYEYMGAENQRIYDDAQKDSKQGIETLFDKEDIFKLDEEIVDYATDNLVSELSDKVTRLEYSINTKAILIEKLESTIEYKNQIISSLENQTDLMSEQIDQLNKKIELLEQYNNSSYEQTANFFKQQYFKQNNMKVRECTQNYKIIY